MSELKYKRILLKISGEALAPAGGVGIDPESSLTIASQVKAVHDMGAEIGIVLGGGNLWRGKIGLQVGMDQATADNVGMLATVMNSLVLMDALEKVGVTTRVQSAIEMRSVAEPVILRRALRHLEKGRVVIFGGGTGNPFCTTDTAGAQRALEMHVDILIKATKVDGIYDCDPVSNPNAKKYDQISYTDALIKDLGVMDGTALTMCRDYHMPLLVLNLWEKEALPRALMGEKVGTLVKE